MEILNCNNYFSADLLFLVVSLEMTPCKDYFNLIKNTKCCLDLYL